MFIFFLSSFSLKLLIKYYFKLDDGNWTFRFFPSEFMFFALGYFGYFLYKKYNLKLTYKYIYLIPFVLLSLLSFIWFIDIPYFIKYACFIFLSFFSVPILFANFKKNNKDRLLGDLSYPMYISQSLFIMIMSIFKVPQVNNFIVISLFTILFSYFLNKYILVKIEFYRK